MPRWRIATSSWPSFSGGSDLGLRAFRVKFRAMPCHSSIHSRLEGEGSDSPDASRVASSARFNSDDFFGNPGLGRAALEESSLNGVRRLVSAQPGALADNSVRARQTLLRLLLQLCQPLSKPQLAALVQRFRLKSHLQRVLAEERRKQRVILSAIASQLLAMFMEAAPGDLDINPNVV